MILRRIILRPDIFLPDNHKDNSSPESTSPESSSLKICFFPEADDSSPDHSSSGYFFTG
jgi:hypothetical protein